MTALALGIWAGGAVADIPTVGSSSVAVSTPALPTPPPVPSLPTPTLPTPTLPTPTLPTPPVPPPPPPPLPPAPSLPPAPVSPPSAPLQQPALPVPVHVSTPSTSTPSTSAPGLGAAGITQGANPAGGSAGVGGGSPGGSSTAGSAAASGMQPSGPSAIGRFSASRPWLSAHGPKKYRTTVLTFRLEHKARVLFTVIQVSPVCRTAGSFSVVGHRGINRIRFSGKLHGRRLPPGTYRIDARTSNGHAALHLVVVIFGSGTPSPGAIALARQSNVCSLALRGSVAVAEGTGGLLLVRAANGRGGEGSSVANSGTEGAQIAYGPHPGVSSLGPDVGSSNVASALALALFGLSVLLLGLAALPRVAVPDPRLAEGLARHGAAVAFAGALAFAAAIVALLIG